MPACARSVPVSPRRATHPRKHNAAGSRGRSSTDRRLESALALDLLEEVERLRIEPRRARNRIDRLRHVDRSSTRPASPAESGGVGGFFGTAGPAVGVRPHRSRPPDHATVGTVSKGVGDLRPWTRIRNGAPTSRTRPLPGRRAEWARRRGAGVRIEGGHCEESYRPLHSSSHGPCASPPPHTRKTRARSRTHPPCPPRRSSRW